MTRSHASDAPLPEGAFPPTEAMLSEPVPSALAEAQADRLRAVWATPKGWRYWSAVNNSEVGVWYALTALAFMLCAGVLALLMRVQLAVPGNDFLSADRFNQFFTMHGSAMMFLFAVPMFEAISIILLPALLGARDLPFPRLSAYGYWCFLIGGVFVMGSILFDAAPKSGWFMYPPLATQDEGLGSDIWLLGLSFIEVASIAAAVELIVGVLKCRPPGMRVNLMPLYAWYVLVVGGLPAAHCRRPPVRDGAWLRLALLRPRAGGRSAALAAPVLDLRAPRGLYHLPALDRAGGHDRADRGTPAHRGLFLDRALGRGNRLSQLWPVGASHVHHRAARALAGVLLGRLRGGGDPDRHPALCLRGDADGGPRQDDPADALDRGRACRLRPAGSPA